MASFGNGSIISLPDKSICNINNIKGLSSIFFKSKTLQQVFTYDKMTKKWQKLKI